MRYINMLASFRTARIVTVALTLAVLTLWWAGVMFASDEVDLGEPSAVVADHNEEHDSDPEANLPFLFAVYIITWGGFFAYSFAMSRRQREMQRELDALRSAIAEKESQDGDGQAV